ncbi:inositol-tetrakisphosphate 1-kinase-like [Lycorma delicatula]|uniref:inositol-tetrakisphosphate 1-kinase-like n=1 Tax=Lycorma delicatula TaxID=130591 RepID=UPI003F50EC63
MSMSDGDNFEQQTKVIGYWMSEKKSQKLNWTDFSTVCRKYGYKLVKLNLDVPLEDQGPFTIILHKLTDIIAKTLQNDEKAIKMIRRVEEYIERHEEVAVLDPLSNVKKLLDRYSSYRAIKDSHLNKFGVFTPSFVELISEEAFTNLQKLKKAGVTFPFVCKPSVSHGSSECHKMAVIFNEAGLKDCKPPCVAQSFVNHNAILFKVYILGEQYYVVERPSLKNFYPCDHGTIFFDSHDVSKSDSTSSLSILDPGEEGQQQHITADPDKVKAIVHVLRNILGMSLLGVDIVVENNTGRHAIIDINAYPGYDGYPNFFDHLLQCIQYSVDNHQQLLKNKINPTSPSPVNRMNIANNSSSINNQRNCIVVENGCVENKDDDNNADDDDDDDDDDEDDDGDDDYKDEESGGDDSDDEAEDDIINSNKNNNEHNSNKNLIVNQQAESQFNTSDLNNGGDKKHKKQLRQRQQQHRRVRTVTAVSGKKSVERQL